MAGKKQEILELALTEAQRIRSGGEAYMDFLSTAARNHKYGFRDQLLIHAQRPDATACAEMGFWNKFRRWVNKGSKDIFWQMNEISHNTQTVTRTEIIESADEDGNIIEEEQEVTKTVLYITVSHKTAAETAAELNFNEVQLRQMDELLSDDYRSLWSSVLYGIHSGDEQLIAVALSQVGNVGGQPYWSWYGFESRVEWCACFVSWCANECGYIDSGLLPKFASCRNGMLWFQSRGQWLPGTAEPSPGMIVFFDWDDENGQDGLPDHVGIVQKVENGMIYTIEGNSGDACKLKTYPAGHYELLGFGYSIF